MQLKQSYQIGIIGAGISGLAFAQKLLACGFTDIVIFEKNDKLGGVWNPNHCYPCQEIESTRAYFEFLEYPWPSGTDMDKPAGSKEIYDYLCNFSEKFKVDEKISYNTSVQQIICQPNGGFQVSGLIGENEFSIKTDFMIVAILHMSGGNYIPKIQGKFKGTILHNTEVTPDYLQNIKQKNQKVLIVGGSKSAVDMVKLMNVFDIQNFTWLYKTMYWVLHYENQNNPDLARRDFDTIYDVFEKYISKGKVWDKECIRALNGVAINLDDENTDFFHNFRFGECTESQLNFLKKSDKIKGEIIKYEGDKVILKDKQSIQADVIIYATGFDCADISIIDNANKTSKKIKDIKYLYRGMVDMDHPKLLFTPPIPLSHHPQSVYFLSLWIAKYIKNHLANNIDIKKMTAEYTAMISKYQKYLGDTAIFKDSKSSPLLYLMEDITIEIFKDIDIDLSKIIPVPMNTSEMLRKALSISI